MTRPPGPLARLRRRWQLAGWLVEAEQSGMTLVEIPEWLWPEVQALRYYRSVERASEKWERRIAEVPLWAWQATMHERTNQRWGNDQAGTGRDEPTGVMATVIDSQRERLIRAAVAEARKAWRLHRKLCRVCAQLSKDRSQYCDDGWALRVELHHAEQASRNLRRIEAEAAGALF